MENIINTNIDNITPVSSDSPSRCLRPSTFDDFIGQTKNKENLKVYIDASKNRGESLDHVLLYGPPGLGKTTLAGIIANEMDSNMKTVSAPSIEKSGDLVAILNGLSDNDVLFIDEIHRLPICVEEVLYSAMEDFKVVITVGKDAQSRAITLDLPHFTLVGATTRAGMISAPLRDRFGIVCRMEFYDEGELSALIKKNCSELGVKMTNGAVSVLAGAGRGTPRIVNRLIRRVRDFSEVKGMSRIDEKSMRDILGELGVSGGGLSELDMTILRLLNEKSAPVGLSTLSSMTGEDEGTIEDVSEPFLIFKGLINKTPRGRVITEEGRMVLGVAA